MALTQADIDDLDAQFAGPRGAVKITRFADGREVTKISVDEYMKLRGLQKAEVESGTSYPSNRTSYATFSKE